MIKSWILKNIFEKFRSDLDALRGFDALIAEARRQGSIEAFPLAKKDILETMRDDLDKQAEELAEKKLAALLSPVDPAKVVTLDKSHGVVYIGGERAEEARLANLRSEAEILLQSELWQLIYETPKELAQKAMFVAGESIDDMKKGRAMLYTLSAQKNIIDIFRGYVPKR